MFATVENKYWVPFATAVAVGWTFSRRLFLFAVVAESKLKELFSVIADRNVWLSTDTTQGLGFGNVNDRRL